MKKSLIALVLACFVAAIAFASLSNRNGSKQDNIEKKQDVKKEKKKCKRSCIFG